MPYRYYIITGIIAYCTFLIATVPAAPVLSMLEDRIPVNITNVTGTLWSGRAGTIYTRRNIRLNNVEWSFQPLRLLLAKASIDVDAEFNNNPLNSRLSAGLSGKLIVDNLDMKLGATDITSLISLPLGELSGEFMLHIDHAVFDPGSVPRVDGKLNWNRATITVAETADLGNVSVLVNGTSESPLAATITNTGGHLALNGKLTTNDQGVYSLQLTMKPNSTASDNLVSSLAMFAKKQRNGEFILNNKGNLKTLGVM
jgi:general secretion pathway protein N